MSILAWLVLGLAAGYVANRLVNSKGEGIVRDVLLGIVGALAGGASFTSFGHLAVTGFDLWSLFVAVLGATLILVLYHAFAPESPSTGKK